MEAFVEMLRGATNSLGRTEEVTAIVIADPTRAVEVYELFFQDDEWVRLRAASTSKRLWRHDIALFEPFIQGWIDHVSALDQPSAQWTFAQMCEECDEFLSEAQRARAIEIVTRYLASADDWIVLNSSMSALGAWAKIRPQLAAEIRPHLKRLSGDNRKSVAKRAAEALAQLP